MTPSSFASFGRGAALAAAAGLFVFLAGPACSSSDDDTCDSSKCAPHNECLPLDGVVQCRRTCTSNTDPAESCPFGYTCTVHDPKPFCVKDNLALTKSPKGQWGAPCKPEGGLDQNPDCDSAQNFYCYGTSPTDAAAYCTQYACTTDQDCAATFYCATINAFPDVRSKSRKIGVTTTACLKRTYCAPCTADFDCPSVDNRPQHCVGDAQGGSFCAPECDASDNCNNEARCLDFGDYKACYPRAGACVGDGSLCSPCRSDADCGEDGACLKGQYTTEYACAKKPAGGCTDASQCPGPGFGAKAPIGCAKEATSEVPAGFCVGIYEFGPSGASDVGCFTPKR
jgi:hypothetical protein